MRMPWLYKIILLTFCILLFGCTAKEQESIPNSVAPTAEVFVKEIAPADTTFLETDIDPIDATETTIPTEAPTVTITEETTLPETESKNTSPETAPAEKEPKEPNAPTATTATETPNESEPVGFVPGENETPGDPL